MVLVVSDKKHSLEAGDAPVLWFPEANTGQGQAVNLPPFREASQTLMSPLTPADLRDETANESLKTIEESTGGVFVLSEVVFGEIKDRLSKFQNPEVYDLSDVNSLEELSSRSFILSEALQYGGQNILLKNFAAFTKEQVGDIKRFWEYMGMLRSLEDNTKEGSFVLIVVEAGEALPEYTHSLDPLSPFALSAHKIGFSSSSLGGWQEASITPTRALRRVIDNLERTRDQVEDLYGTERRKLYLSIINRVMSGENILFRGPRRGGKTSLNQCLRTVIKSNENFSTVEVEYYDKLPIISHHIAQNVFKDLSEEQTQYLLDSSLAELPSRINKLVDDGCQYSGKHVCITFDEWLEYGAQHDDARYFELFDFAKDVREQKIPISVLCSVTDFVYPIVMQKAPKYNATPRDAHLSAFSVEQVGLMEDSEARELLEHYIDKYELSFYSRFDREQCIQDGIQVCSGNPYLLSIYMSKLLEGKSNIDAINFVLNSGKKIFDIYFRNSLNSFQRKVILSCAFSKEGSCTITKPSSGTYAELNMMEKMGYISFEQKSVKVNKIKVKLAKPFFHYLASDYCAEYYRDKKHDTPYLIKRAEELEYPPGFIEVLKLSQKQDYLLNPKVTAADELAFEQARKSFGYEKVNDLEVKLHEESIGDMRTKLTPVRLLRFLEKEKHEAFSTKNHVVG